MREPRRLHWKDAIQIINIAKQMIDLGEYQPFVAAAVSEIMIGHDTLFSCFLIWEEEQDIEEKKQIALDMDSYLMYTS